MTLFLRGLAATLLAITSFGCASLNLPYDNFNSIRYVPYLGFPSPNAPQRVREDAYRTWRPDPKTGDIRERHFGIEAKELYFDEAGLGKSLNAYHAAFGRKNGTANGLGGALLVVAIGLATYQDPVKVYTQELKLRLLPELSDAQLEALPKDSQLSPEDELIDKLEEYPTVDSALIKDTDKRLWPLLYQYYEIKGVSDIDSSLIRVGWRDLTQDQMGDFYRLSGADAAYRDWQESRKLRLSPRTVMVSMTVLGALAGALAVPLGFAGSNDGYPVLDGIVIATAGALGGGILSIPFALATPWEYPYEKRAQALYRQHLESQFGRNPTPLPSYLQRNEELSAHPMAPFFGTILGCVAGAVAGNRIGSALVTQVGDNVETPIGLGGLLGAGLGYWVGTWFK
jgi:hypothetical protein